MTKYDKLKEHLFRCSEKVTLSTKEVEKILGFALPSSAYKHRAFWSNSRSHPIAHAWLDAGYKVINYDSRRGIHFSKDKLTRVNQENYISRKYETGISECATNCEWFWEGNIQKKIANYLVKNEGWEIESMSNCSLKNRGPDILATRSGKVMRVEVKGYPSPIYSKDSLGGKKGEVKRTNPTTQARHWISEALFGLELAKCENENLNIALGLPHYLVYINLLNRLTWLREKLNLVCYMVNEGNEVKLFLPKEKIA